MQFNKEGKLIGKFKSVKEAAVIIGRSAQAINDCLQGRTHFCADSKFKYILEDIDMEIWNNHPYLDIKVSDQGRFQRKDGAKSFGCKSSRGYLYCGIGEDTFLVHRLIAETFCEESMWQGDNVDHIDGNPSNNKAENLEWVTQKENIQRYFRSKKKITDASRSSA